MTTKSDKPNQPAPRYDDVHADGVAWLDELATEDATDRGTERLVEIDPTEVERVRTGPVSAEEALEIAQRFIDGHFRNGKEGPRISIPADPKRDDDLRLVAFIEQSAAEIERLKRDLEGVKEREREHVTRAQNVADEMRRERDAAVAERDEARALFERSEASASKAFCDYKHEIAACAWLEEHFRVALLKGAAGSHMTPLATIVDRLRDRDRLRRGIEALIGETNFVTSMRAGWVAERLGALLKGVTTPTTDGGVS